MCDLKKGSYMWLLLIKCMTFSSVLISVFVEWKLDRMCLNIFKPRIILYRMKIIITMQVWEFQTLLLLDHAKPDSDKIVDDN